MQTRRSSVASDWQRKAAILLLLRPNVMLNQHEQRRSEAQHIEESRQQSCTTKARRTDRTRCSAGRVHSAEAYIAVAHV